MMKKFIQSVRTAQRLMRTFLGIQRARIDVLDRIWLELEKRERPFKIALAQRKAIRELEAQEARLEDERVQNTVHWRWHKLHLTTNKTLCKLDDLQAEAKIIARRQARKAAPRGPPKRDDASDSSSAKTPVIGDELLWNQLLVTPVDYKRRRKVIKEWLMKNRKWHVARVNEERELAAQTAVKHKDAREFLMGGVSAAKKVRDKQLGTFTFVFPPMLVLVHLKRQKAQVHRDWAPVIEQTIYTDVDARIRNLVDRGRASVIQREILPLKAQK